MKETAQYLRKTIQELKPFLLDITEKGATLKPNPAKWSKKEIIGHLIDSACNNQQKFVRLLQNTVDEGNPVNNGKGVSLDFVGYAQDNWVAVQHYQEASWENLVNLWVVYNLHIAHIIEHANPAALKNTITINGVGNFRLDFIMRDYVEHLKHHLKVVLPDLGIESAFTNVYNA
jgi:DinB superfamily